MSKTAAFENDFLLLLFNNVAIANIGDATGLPGSATAGQLFFSLHTADPTESGNQSSNEISYTGYARVGRARNGTNFTVSGASPTGVATAAPVDFGQMTGGTGGTATHFGIGVASAGTTRLLYKGALSPTISVVNGVTPRIATGTVVTEQ